MSENLGRKPVEGNEKVFWENLDGWQVWFGLRGNVAPFAIISVDEGLECSFIWDQRILYHFFQNEQRSPLKLSLSGPLHQNTTHTVPVTSGYASTLFTQDNGSKESVDDFLLCVDAFADLMKASKGQTIDK